MAKRTKRPKKRSYCKALKGGKGIKIPKGMVKSGTVLVDARTGKAFRAVKTKTGMSGVRVSIACVPKNKKRYLADMAAIPSAARELIGRLKSVGITRKRKK